MIKPDDKIKILLVDDRTENILALEAHLEELELHIYTALSGEEALTLMLEHDFGLVLLDVQMPGMNGFEVAEIMKKRKKTRDIPIIFVTAINKDQAYVFKGYEHGAVDYLFKPLEPLIVRSKVKVFSELFQQKQALKKTLLELEASNQAKSNFLATMSHELRTPLNIIIGYSELLMEDAEEDSNQELENDLNKIRGSAQHLLGLINDVLDISKIEAGKMDVFLEEIPLTLLIEDIHQKITPLINKNANQFILNKPNQDSIITSDRRKITQILYNLLSNAAKFTSKGTITFTIDFNSLNSTIDFIVEDTGIGINQSNQAKLFQLFSQVDSSYSRNFEGTGLGLALSQQLAIMLEGSIQVQSTEGKGSTFIFSLPIEMNFEQKEDLPYEIFNGKKHPIILCIDDDPDIQDILHHLLGQEDFIHISAANGTIGLQKALKHKPDLITLDVNMPGENGWSVLKEIRKDPKLKDIPVIMLTMTPDEEQLAYVLGASDYLTKPIDARKLVQVIKSYIIST